MLKLRTILLLLMAGGVLVSLPSVASAQLPQSVVDQLTPKYRSQGPCSDPWITIAINDVFGNTRKIQGGGETGECNKSLYNGGTWSNYAELYKAVKTYFDKQTAANAQPWYPADVQRWVNNPCADARISWGLWNETAMMQKPQGGVDCDPANYNLSQVKDAPAMDRQIEAYRRWQRSALTLGPVITSNGLRTQQITDLRSGASINLEVGRVVAQGGGNLVSTNGGNVVGPGGASVVAQGGGNLLTSDGAGIVSHDGGTLVSQGLNNHQGILATGEKVIQLRGRWFKVRG